MALSEADKADIEEGMYEIYEALFSHEVDFLTFNTVGNTLPVDSVYDEKKYKSYLPAIRTIGKVKIKTSEEQLRDSGVFQKYDATFSFTKKELDVKLISSLGEELILKSAIEYKGIRYEIVDLKPEMILADIIFKYTMKGKRIRV